MKIQIVAILVFIINFQLFALEIPWNGSVNELNLGLSIDYLEEKNGEWSIDQASKAYEDGLFTSSEQTILNFGFNESVYWLHFSINNQSDDDLILQVGHASLPICNLYYKTTNGQFIELKSGYQVPLYNKKVPHHFQLFRLPEGDHSYFIRVISNSHPLPIKVMNETAFAIDNTQQKMVYGAYLGFMLFVIITNLFFFFTHRNRLYLYYSLVVFIYACYAAMVLDGFVLYVFPNIDMMFWYITIPTIGMTVQTAYCLAFLEVKKYKPLLYKVVLGIVIYFAAYIFWKHLLPLSTILAINTVHALISFFVMGYIGVRVGLVGNRMGYYYALAYFIYFALVLTEAVYIQTGSPQYILGLSHVAYATLIEAFVLSYLLSKRSEWEKRASEEEKLLAQKELVKSMQENERIVREQNVLLEKKVKKRTRSIKQMNNQLKKAMETKDRFFSIIAHDLRAPFNSLIGLSEVMATQSDSLPPKEQRNILRSINESVVTTHDLLNNLLLWSQSQKEEINLHIEETNIHTLTDQLFKFLQQTATKKDVTITNTIPVDTVLNTDANMLQTILLNLLSNAIKFCKRGGHVSLGVQNESGGVVFSVEDDGVGLSKKQQNHLFNLVKHSSTEGTEKEKGTGLGLLICKEFTQKLHGQIWVKSTEGQGATFFVRVPSLAVKK